MPYITDTGSIQGASILQAQPEQQLQQILPFLLAMMGGPGVGAGSALRSGGAMNPGLIESILQANVPGSRGTTALLKQWTTHPITGRPAQQYVEKPVSTIEELMQALSQARGGGGL